MYGATDGLPFEIDTKNQKFIIRLYAIDKKDYKNLCDEYHGDILLALNAHFRLHTNSLLIPRSWAKRRFGSPHRSSFTIRIFIDLKSIFRCSELLPRAAGFLRDNIPKKEKNTNAFSAVTEKITGFLWLYLTNQQKHITLISTFGIVSKSTTASVFVLDCTRVQL